MPQHAGSKPISVPGANTLDESLRLERAGWGNWVFFASTIIVTTLGLAAAMMMASQGSASSIWPWSGTQEAMLTGLCSLVVVLVLHSSREQRQVIRLRRELLTTQQAASERLGRHIDRLGALRKVSRTMGLATDSQTVLDAITQSCLETFGADRVSLMLLGTKGSDLEVRSAAGADDMRGVVGARLRLGQGVAGWVAQNKSPLILGARIDTAQYADFTPKPDAPAAAMVVPVTVREELVGVLNVSSHVQGAEYTQEDLEALMVFAEDAGISCRHAEQTEWMRLTIQRLDAELLIHENPTSARRAA